MAITKVTSGLISADAASVDLNIDAGTLYVDSTNNRVGVANTNPSVALDVTGAVTVSGTLTASSLIYPTSDGTSGQALVTDGSGNLSFSTIQGYTDSDVESYLDGGTSTPTFASATVTGEITANGGIALGTNDKATFGASDTFEIYTDGTDSFIKETAAGSLKLLGTNIDLANAANTELGLRFITNGAVTLYYDGSPKIATTSTGIDVTGTAVVDALTSSGQLELQASTPSIHFLDTDDNSDGYIQANAGTLRFYADDSNEVGSSIITFNIDGSEQIRIDNAGNLSVGTTSTQATGTNIKVSDGNVARLIFEHTGASGKEYAWYSSGTGQAVLYDYDGSAERIVVNSSGNVGIGAAFPQGTLHIADPTTNTDSELLIGYQGTSAGGNVLGSIWFGSAESSGYRAAGIKSTADQDFNANDTPADLSFWTTNDNTTGATQKMVITSGGKVGIGTTNPSGNLHISGGGYAFRLTDTNITDANHNTLVAYAPNLNKFSLGVSSTTGLSPDITIDGANNRVGIGTTSPAHELQVQDSSSNGTIRIGAGAGLDIEHDNSGTTMATIKQLYATTSASAQLRFMGGFTTFHTGTSNTERMRILAGGGLTFNGDTAAANALDDYEEGEWTPTCPNVTLSSSGGHYTKIGNRVWVTFYLQFPTTSNTNAVQVNNLPFTVKNHDSGQARANANRGGWTVGYSNSGQELRFIASSGTTTITAHNFDGNTVNNNNVSAKAIYAGGYYEVA